MKIIAVNNIANQFKQSINKQIYKIAPKHKKVQEIVPFVTAPIVMYMSLKGIRDTNNTNNCREAIKEQKQLLKEHKISQQEYDSRVKEIKEYYKQADNLPEDVSSYKIKSKEPNFRGSETQNSEGLSDYTISSEHDTFSGKIPINENIPDNIDFKQLDVSLSPDLQRAVDMSSIDSGDDLISSILDYVPGDGYDLNKDLFENFKDMLENLF